MEENMFCFLNCRSMTVALWLHCVCMQFDVAIMASFVIDVCNSRILLHTIIYKLVTGREPVKPPIILILDSESVRRGVPVLVAVEVPFPTVSHLHVAPPPTLLSSYSPATILSLQPRLLRRLMALQLLLLPLLFQSLQSPLGFQLSLR